MRPNRQIRDDLAEVDVIDRDVIRSEVGDVQARVIERHDAASRLTADEIAARNFVARGFDNGDAAGVEVESSQFSTVWLERETHRRFSDIEEREQLVVLGFILKSNACNLARSGTGNECLAGIRQDGNVLWMNADVNRGADGEARGIDDGDGIVSTIGDHDGGSIRRNASEARTSANMKGSRNRATVKIEHRNIGRPRISNVGAVAVRRNFDEEGASVDPDGGNNFVLLRVDHADVRGASVHDVNFVSLGIGRNSSRVNTNL